MQKEREREKKRLLHGTYLPVLLTCPTWLGTNTSQPVSM